MHHLDSIAEFAFINRMAQNLTHHPDQVNKRHEADAEILRRPDGTFLAATVDTLYEEYHLGLIRTPRVLGWNLVSNALSDLAAVAAQPLGVLLALTIPPDQDHDWTRELFEGINAAITGHGTWCLGGDTSFGSPPGFSCTALGTITRPTPLLRTGAGHDDLLYVTGPLGAGNTLAIAHHVSRELWESREKQFLPRARLSEMQVLHPFAKCAIDTSDSLVQTLSILASVNHVGIDISPTPDLYIPEMTELTARMNFPLWLTNVLGLGEYEIVLAVGRDREAAFLAEAARHAIPVKKLGATSPEPGIRICDGERVFPLDIPHLLNLFGKCSSREAYLEALIEYDRSLRNTRP